MLSTITKNILIFFSVFLVHGMNNAQVDTLAVTPFKVIGDLKDADIYGYGVPEAIANDLSKIPGLTVIERLRLSSVLQELKLSQAGLISEQNAPRIGEMLGARVIIVGSVQKLGKEVRVHARAVSTVSGEVIFSVKADKKIMRFRDVFELEDAFKQYSSGFKYFDSGDYESGLKHFQRAAAIDKNFDWAQEVRIRAQKAFEELDREIKN